MRRGVEWRWVSLVSLGIVLLASIPYLFGYAIAPTEHEFIGLTRNVDDALVYLSWMRQAADGHFFTRNLFTSEPQVGHGVNLLFYGLGRFAGTTHLPLIVVFHAARLIFGAGLLMLVYAFSRLWIADIRGRRLVLLVTGFSAGLGWLIPVGEGFDRSVDLWQPEAITFLSIYLSPLFSFSLILMLGSLYLLQVHGATGRTRYAVCAGLLLLILGNVHSYDVIPIGMTWALCALASLLRRPRNARPLVGGLIAAVIGMPSAAYQAYIYLHEPVFRLRADVPTLSPSIVFYLLGFGLLIPLAALGVRRLMSNRADYGLLACWVIMAVAAAYLPISFQRKLVMGAHIPLSILAGMGLAAVTEGLRGRAAVTAAALVILVPSNVVFLAQDMARVIANEPHTTAHAPFVSKDELAALDYLRRHSRPGDIVLAQPPFASLVPAFTGRTVYCGHWGETARFEEKLRQVLTFFAEPDEVEHHMDFVRRHGIVYVADYHQLPRDHPAMARVVETGDIAIFQVR